MIAPIDANRISAEEYWDILTRSGNTKSGFNSLRDVERVAKRPIEKCSLCGQFDAWKLAQTNLCFVCTTGETDASDDYELI